MSGSERPAYEVRLRSKRVRRELDDLVEADYRRAAAKLLALEKDPRPPGCEKLGGEYNLYRVRVGDIRIIYLIDEPNKRVDIGGVKRRSERTYRKLEDLFR